MTLAQSHAFECDSIKVDYYNAILANSELVHRCPTILIDTLLIPKKFLINSQHYLIQRVGVNFYSKLKLEDARTIDTEHDYSWWADKPRIDMKSAKNLKYSFCYSFLVEDSMKYYFSVSFDKNGKRISPHCLPSLRRNQNFNRKITACYAVSVANLDTVFPGNAKNITFEYYPKTNGFIWTIGKPDIHIDEENVIIKQVLINVKTGKIVKRRELKGIIVKPTPL